MTIDRPNFEVSAMMLIQYDRVFPSGDDTISLIIYDVLNVFVCGDDDGLRKRPEEQGGMKVLDGRGTLVPLEFQILRGARDSLVGKTIRPHFELS